MIREPARTALAVVTLAVALVATGCSAGPAQDPDPPELAGPAGVAPASQAGHPNVLFVLTDDLDTSLLRYMPHVQQLAARGASFAADDDADTLCCPSRSSIFTGAFPHDTGVFTNSAPDGGYDVFHSRGDEADTDAVALQKAGYTTAMMGKYLNGYQPTDGPAPGWNEWDVAGNGYPEFDYDLNVNGTIAHHGHADSDYMPDVLGQRGSDFITAQSAAHRPFFLEVATFAPHAPYTPAPRHSQDFPGLQAPRDPSFNQPDAPTAPAWLRDRTPLRPKQVTRLDNGYRKRAQASASVDDMLAGLEAALDRTGQTANTQIVFSSDNGYHMGQHELSAGKQTTFATDLVVPLIVAGPGVVHRTIPERVQNIDVAPTVTDLAHAPPLPIADGRSLVPLLAGADPPDWRNAALVEHHGPNLAPDDPDRTPGKSAANPPSYGAVATGSVTYTEYATGEKEYHDTATDPYQRDNTVATVPPERLAALHATLTALENCHGTAACWAAGHVR
ncbi:sulfatase [Actinomycetospora endophytica]|uniref:Sulfatase n=1 Tax=Actinomycetospora endophytica TaxID=2291215 RepID=A0ABS8P2K6_9PSEU|nr:sulfatase [Actinomycetospora endophytica]MCD2192458.1 sulfatase [Actinomycetospora endophytica]